MAVTFSGAGSGGGSSYSSQPTFISQDVPGGGPNQRLPKILPPPKGQRPSVGGYPQGAFSSGGQGANASSLAYGSNLTDLFQSALPYTPTKLGGGGGVSGGGGGGGAASALAGQLASAQQRAALDATKLQGKLGKFQYGQLRDQAKYDKEAVGRLGEGYASLLDNYNEAYGQARGANEARYQQMLGIADATTGQRQADVSSAYNQRSSDVSQQLSRLGMGNTTVAPTMQFGVERERQSALNRVADEMQQTKLGIIERKEDDYPDLQSLQSIIAGTGSAFGTRGIDAMLSAFGKVRSV